MTIAHAYRDSSGTLQHGQIFDTMVYDGRNRRIQKTISNTGQWDCNYHYYYTTGWQLIETRNGSSQTLKQHVWGMGDIDELVQIAANANPGTGNTCSGWFYAMQDANFNVLGLVNTSGQLVERYEYTPYGQRKVLFAAGNTWAGGTSTNDSGCYAIAYASPRYTSSAPYFGLCDFGHQSLFHDEEAGSVYNRRRYLHVGMAVFLTRDVLREANAYLYLNQSPLMFVDPTGRDAFGVPSTQPSTQPAGPQIPVSAGVTYVQSKIDEYEAKFKNCWLYKASGLDKMFQKIRGAAGKVGAVIATNKNTQGVFDNGAGKYNIPPTGYGIDTAVHESVHAYNYVSGDHQSYGNQAMWADEGMAWSTQDMLDVAQFLCLKFKCVDCSQAQRIWNSIWKQMENVVGSPAGNTNYPANITRTQVWDVSAKLNLRFSESQLRPLFQQALISRNLNCQINNAPLNGTLDQDNKPNPFQ